MRDSRVAIKSCLDKMATDINKLRDDQRKMSDKIKTNEHAILTLVPVQADHATQLDVLRLQLERLQDRTDDAELKGTMSV
ncbi:hypothetical protein NDU88_000466 [Pleurodeles waltl]|uniref:Uncharacterized protein n=1 Tax=Pleurodeles waltl TaxID=8319 RepID=A0AAV7NG65_PLEWA|nr:hypothetical protein NDU88_000466 [Pleurodeles waltl]